MKPPTPLASLTNDALEDPQAEDQHKWAEVQLHAAGRKTRNDGPDRPQHRVHDLAQGLFDLANGVIETQAAELDGDLENDPAEHHEDVERDEIADEVQGVSLGDVGGLIEAVLGQPAALVPGDRDAGRRHQDHALGDLTHGAVQGVGEAAGEVDEATHHLGLSSS